MSANFEASHPTNRICAFGGMVRRSTQFFRSRKKNES